MSASRALGLSSFLICLAAGSLVAQETRIRVVQSGADNLMADLESIVTSTPNKPLQKQWKNLAEILDGFLIGVHRGEPMRVDLVVAKDDAGKASLGYQPSFPIAIGKNGKEVFEGKGDTFIENVKSIGYKVTKKGDGFYELVESNVKGAKPMYLRHKHGYAIISQSQKALPANIEDPKKGVDDLTKLGYDVTAELKNDPATEKARREDFKELRKELEAAIKFKRGEDESEFELRKLGVVQFFDEMERFLIEANQLLVGWTTDAEGKTGKGDLTLSANDSADKTSLKTSIELLAKNPNYFANVKLHDKPVITGKMQFPFDELRKEQAKVRHPLLKKVTELQIDKSTKYSAEAKTAAKECLGKLIEIFDETIAADIGIEGFIDLHDIGGGSCTGVAGLRAEKAKNVDDIVSLLPKISDKWSVKMNAVEHGGVSLHEVTISDNYKEEFAALFGKEQTFYIGASEKAVWAAAGKDSLDELKAAIDAVAQPAPTTPDPVFASVDMRFGPLIKLIDAVEKKIVLSDKATKSEIQAKKERDRLRLLALEAFEPGTDLLTGRMSRVNGEIKGELTINEGIFKFLGSAIADFSKQNLQ